MSYKIKVLSPLHIGCGETYTGLNYVLAGNRLFYVDSDTVLAVLDGKVEEFVEWIEINSQKIELLETKKRKAKDRDEKRSLNRQIRETKSLFNISEFCKKSGISINKLCDSSTYSIKYIRGINSGSEINAYIKQMNQAYIPGTEIKGAIRTAVAYCALMDNSRLYSNLKNRIEEYDRKYCFLIDCVKNEKNLRKTLAETVSLNRIPQRFGKFTNWKLGKIKEKILDEEMKKHITKDLMSSIFNAQSRDDAKYDLLKYLHVGDSELKPPADVLSIANAEPVNIGAKFSLLYEYVEPETEFNLTDLSIEAMSIRAQKMEKMSFDKRHKETISSIDFILKYCHRFSNDLIDEELEFFTNRHKDNDILNHLNIIASYNKPDSPLLRIGKDEGYLSVTVALAVKKNDPDLYEKVLIHATKSKSYTGRNLLPKSRKIVCYDGKKLTSGWVQLIKDTPSRAVQDEKTQPGSNHLSVDITPLLKKYGRQR